MILIDLLQVGLGDRSNYRGVEEDGPFGRGRSETNRIIRRTNEGKDKMTGDRGVGRKGPAVTQLIMSIRRKYGERDMKRSKNRKVTRLGGAQMIYCLSLNTGKLEFTGAFFPGKICNLMLVRGTISFYNQRLQIFPIEGSVMWNMPM